MKKQEIDWKPQTGVETLRRRGELLSRIRKFFDAAGVLEVETPLLASATATDVHIQSLQVSGSAIAPENTMYLQTSPEFSMKRLLGFGSGPIYQICKSFRDEEAGKRHNPEFTMLEWYQPGYSMMDLMDEVDELIQNLLGCESIQRVSYRDIFQQLFGFDPHEIQLKDLRTYADSKMDLNSNDLEKTDLLQLLLDANIETSFPTNLFIYDFPIEQSALAVIEQDSDGVPVAKRFELFCNGMEIANGYFELLDSIEQRRRFEADIAKRSEKGLAEYPLDEKLIAAMESGIPACAGVALGVDRLLMLLTESSSISQVISFSTGRA